MEEDEETYCGAHGPIWADRLGRMEWWDWIEALSWVQTRSYKIMGSDRALREYYAGSATPLEGASLVDLLMITVPDPEVIADQIYSELQVAQPLGLRAQGRNREGELVEIASNEWRESRVKIDVMTPYLSHSAWEMGRYSDPIFSREDLQRLFPSPDQLAVPPASQISSPVASSEPKRHGGGRKVSKKDWENFCAALAVVAATDVDGVQFDVSAASIYEKVALVLQARLGQDANYLGKDSVTDAITLAQAWIKKGMPE